MLLLEVELNDDAESRKRTIENFIGRVVVVEHPEFNRIKGKIIGCKENYFELRKPINDILAFFVDIIYDVSYQEMQKMSLVEPNICDYVNEERRRIIKSNHVF